MSQSSLPPPPKRSESEERRLQIALIQRINKQTRGLMVAQQKQSALLAQRLHHKVVRDDANKRWKELDGQARAEVGEKRRKEKAEAEEKAEREARERLEAADEEEELKRLQEEGEGKHPLQEGEEGGGDRGRSR